MSTTPTAEALTRKPSEADIKAVRASTVQDKDGKDILFGSLVDGADQRTITVLIRHFDCGNCMEYVRALAKTLSPSTLSTMTPPTKLIILGCGQSSRIAQYASLTSCPYDIYADPHRAVFQRLGCLSTLAGGTGTPSYITRSFGAGLVESIGSMISGGLRGGGKVSQNGAEVVWIDGRVEFIHRMPNTTGHLEVAELEEKLRGHH